MLGFLCYWDQVPQVSHHLISRPLFLLPSKELTGEKTNMETPAFSNPKLGCGKQRAPETKSREKAAEVPKG